MCNDRMVQFIEHTKCYFRGKIYYESETDFISHFRVHIPVAIYIHPKSPLPFWPHTVPVTFYKLNLL